MAKKYIGEIKFIPTGEVERFTEIDKFLSELRRLIDTVGVMGVNSRIYDKNNLDYQYEHTKVIGGAFGCDIEPKTQYLIEHTSPEFNLQKKLFTIRLHEEILKTDRVITCAGSGDKIFLSPRIADTMSIKNIKRLVDRRYKKAIQRKQYDMSNDNRHTKKYHKKHKDEDER